MAINDSITSEQEEGHRTSIVELLLAFAALLIWFCLLASKRLIARDEGFYAFATSLLLDGQLPSIDFFYPQMPLLPLVYGIWGTVLGDDFFVYRLLSALFSSATGLLLFLILRRRVSLAFALLGVFLYASSHFVYPWYVTTQTYASSVFFLLLSFYFLLKRRGEGCAGCLVFWSGIFFGIAGDIRLFFLALFPIFTHIVFWGTQQERFKQLLLFCFGMALPLSVLLYPLFLDADSFLFNNLWYHLLRSDLDLSSALEQKWVVSKVLLGLKESVKFDGIQYPLLLGGTLLSGIVFFFKRSDIVYCCYIAFALVLVSLLPTPAYVQYFCTVVPFLIVPTVFLLSLLFQKQKIVGGLVLLLFLSVYSWHIPLDLKRYTETGRGVIGISSPKFAPDWTLTRLTEVQSMLSKHIPQGSEVATLWPGYLVGAEYRSVTGLENHFGLLAAEKISEQERRRYLLLSKAELQQAMKHSKYKYFLTWRRQLRSGYRAALKEGGYQVLDSVGGVHLYTKTP